MSYIVDLGHNSPRLLQMTKPNGAFYTSVDMGTISRAYLKYIPISGADAEYIDSATQASAFDWSTYASEGKLLFDFGLYNLTVGRDPKAEIVVYDSTYTSGRVWKVDLEVNDDALGDIDLADVLTVITAGSGAVSSVYGRTGAVVAIAGDYSSDKITNKVYNFTDSQTLTTAHLNSSVRMLSSASKTFILPSMGLSNDGAYIDVVKAGTGTVALNTADTDKIGTSDATTLTMTGTGYSHIRIEYVHSITTWIVHRMGSISGS